MSNSFFSYALENSSLKPINDSRNMGSVVSGLVNGLDLPIESEQEGQILTEALMEIGLYTSEGRVTDILDHFNFSFFNFCNDHGEVGANMMGNFFNNLALLRASTYSIITSNGNVFDEDLSRNYFQLCKELFDPQFEISEKFTPYLLELTGLVPYNDIKMFSRYYNFCKFVSFGDANVAFGKLEFTLEQYLLK